MFNSHSCVEPGDEARKEHKTQVVFDVCILSVVVQVAMNKELEM